MTKKKVNEWLNILPSHYLAKGFELRGIIFLLMTVQLPELRVNRSRTLGQITGADSRCLKLTAVQEHRSESLISVALSSIKALHEMLKLIDTGSIRIGLSFVDYLKS